jgi:predicted TIM-barrel fold metal-dependent hydrolase
MTIDVNAYLGPFAFRPLRHNTAAGLLRLMDRKRIDRAVVSSASAIAYRNAHAGNEELAAEIKSHRDRFIPFAVLNPAYSDWKHDLRVCQEQYGMKGVRLYPNWHKYKLTDWLCLDLVRAAAQRKMAISIPMRVEDRRQGHWLADVPDVSHADEAALVKAVPEAQFILVNGAGYAGSALGKKESGLPANYAIDLSLINDQVSDELGQLRRNLGDDRLVFGTGMPFHYPDPALLKLEILDAPAAVKQQIASGNARRILHL